MVIFLLRFIIKTKYTSIRCRYIKYYKFVSAVIVDFKEIFNNLAVLRIKH